MQDSRIEEICKLDPRTRTYLLKSMDMLQLSVRSYSRILKVARTIADLRGKKKSNWIMLRKQFHFEPLINRFR